MALSDLKQSTSRTNPTTNRATLNQPTQTQTPSLRDRLTGNKSQTPTFGSRTPFSTVKNKDLKTTQGLEKAVQSFGLQEKTKAIPTRGEDPNEIYSGGFFSDIFDTMNLLQHGVTGVIKGQSFSEGVKSRASFSDNSKNVVDLIAGIGLDIAVDPLTYIAPWTVASKIGKATKLNKLAKGTIETLEKTRAGQKLGSMFVYRFGQDPLYKAIAERTTKAQQIGIQNIVDLVRPLNELDGATQRAVAEARKAGKLTELAPEVLSKAKPAFDELDKLGKEAVDLGLLNKETYDANVGKYIARLYRSKEIPEEGIDKLKTTFGKAPIREDLSRFMKRKDIPEEVREAMGEIMEAGYPTAKAMVQLKGTIENAKFFKEVSKIFGKTEALEGFTKMADTKRLGELSGKYLPKFIADDINQIIDIKSPNSLTKLGNKAMATFKFAKVPANPATHVRNVISNLMLNSWEGLNPLTPSGAKAYTLAAKEMVKPGKFYKEAVENGLGLNTFAANELRSFLEMPEMNKLSKAVRNGFKKMADIYEKEEQFAKLAQYIFQRGKNVPPEEAWKIAERATFNYAQVTPFIRKVRESMFGMPFITFTYKVTPQAVKTAAKNPTRISNIGKIKNAIENLSDNEELTRERASEPDWVRDGFYMKLPGKDKFGRSMYLDLTYIIPFGDLIGGTMFSRNIERDSGFNEGFPSAFVGKTFLPNIVKELVNNQDFLGNKIYKESDDGAKRAQDIMLYLTKVMAPPTIGESFIPGGFRNDGTRRPGAFERSQDIEQGGLEQGGRQTRSAFQELLRNAGLKISPVDIETQENFSERLYQQQLKTILKESGDVGEFTIPYLKEDKEQ